MPDEITVTPKAATTSTPDRENQNSVRSQLTNICALGLGGSFFLPWARFLGIQVSGFDLQKGGDGYYLLWCIPVFSGIVILGGIAKKNQADAARITGVIPFAIAAYWFYRLGSDLMQLLDYGAFLSLIFAAGLLMLPEKTK